MIINSPGLVPIGVFRSPVTPCFVVVIDSRPRKVGRPRAPAGERWLAFPGPTYVRRVSGSWQPVICDGS